METQIEQLTKEFHTKLASEIPNSSIGQCKAVYKEPINNTSSNETNQVSFIANDDTQEEDKVPTRVLPCQLPPKELNPGIQENCNPRPKDYPFKEWLLTKGGYTDVSEPVKKALLKSWLIDCFLEELVKDPRSRSFDDYKWVFDLEIDQLVDEYELGIEKKGHMLNDVWENCKKV
ncbi:hypothetical protein Tco_1337011 [Tanacetum coccineum]